MAGITKKQLDDLMVGGHLADHIKKLSNAVARTDRGITSLVKVYKSEGNVRAASEMRVWRGQMKTLKFELRKIARWAEARNL